MPWTHHAWLLPLFALLPLHSFAHSEPRSRVTSCLAAVRLLFSSAAVSLLHLPWTHRRELLLLCAPLLLNFLAFNMYRSLAPSISTYSPISGFPGPTAAPYPSDVSPKPTYIVRPSPPSFSRYQRVKFARTIDPRLYHRFRLFSPFRPSGHPRRITPTLYYSTSSSPCICLPPGTPVRPHHPVPLGIPFFGRFRPLLPSLPARRITSGIDYSTHPPTSSFPAPAHPVRPHHQSPPVPAVFGFSGLSTPRLLPNAPPLRLTTLYPPRPEFSSFQRVAFAPWSRSVHTPILGFPSILRLDFASDASPTRTNSTHPPSPSFLRPRRVAFFL
ncbi:hypothetical protein R3P38DRAFT_3245837 [Favolaschia claudopus]|uniref:Uncharacterized protein n=1 Tax=Favolaschia claudopus TaxID=2862362 RepID=A0AAV9YZR2_9AGAR